jgi:aryl-alcohol dehydrogenase
VPEVATAAIAFTAGEPFELRDVELDDPRPNEVLVKVHACGVCHTDKAARDQQLPAPLPIVLGHEAAGVVERVGSAVAKVVPGDRVLLVFGSCGNCPNCAVGMTMHCYDGPSYNFLGTRLDGTTAISLDGSSIHSHFIGQSSFATHAIVSERSVMKLSDDVPFEIVAPFGCCVITGAGTVLNAFEAEAGSSIAIFGVGGVGMSALLAAHVTGCATIIAIDVNPARLHLASELGATHIVDARTADPVEAIRKITARGVNYAVDCTGVAGILRQASDSTAPLGTTAAVGSPPMGTEVSLDIISLIISGRRLIGVADGWSVPEVFVPRLLELWRQGRFPIERILQTFPFAQINEAVDAAAKGAVIKPVLTMA